MTSFVRGDDFQFDADDIYWIHWEDRQFGQPQENQELADELKLVEQGLLALKRKGVRLVWTVHNFLPHNSARDMAAIDAGRKMLVPMMDVVHVHTPHAKQVMSEAYKISEDQLCVVSHPSYLGQLEAQDITLARRDVLPKQDRRAFIHIGKVQENRGGQFLWAGLKTLAKHTDAWKIDIAGKVSRSERRGLRWIRKMGNVNMPDRFLPDDEFRDMVAAAHVCVAPFERVFSSGSIMMALTFGLPVVAPDLPAIRDHLPKPLHRFLYSPGNKRAFMLAMRGFVLMEDAELLELRRIAMDHALSIQPLH
ncbi:MAG: glycosyltransferase, partial [Roseibium sp.]